MKKFLCIFLSVITVGMLFSSCSKVGEYTFDKTVDAGLSIVTFNCAAPWGSYSNGTSSGKRVKLFAAYMNAVKPDLIGTQEMNSKWQEKLSELMPDYACYGVKRGGDDKERTSEMNSIFWKKDKFTCIFQDTFWLSESVSTEGKFPGAGCNRICSFVILQNNETLETIIHLNTHLDNESEAARQYGAAIIMSKVEMLLDEYTGAKIILTGDLNCEKDSEAYSAFKVSLSDCSDIYEGDSKATYHNWGQTDEGTPIDFIFTNGEAVNYQYLDDISNGYVSDHYGLYAQIN